MTVGDWAMKRFQIVLEDRVSHYPLVIGHHESFQLVLGGDNQSHYNITVDGFVDIVALEGTTNSIILTCSVNELGIFLLMNGTPSIMNLNSISTESMQIQQYLEEQAPVIIQIIGNVAESLIVDAAASENTTEFETPAGNLILVRLSVVSDWTDYYINDLQDKFMEEMIYTEVV